MPRNPDGSLGLLAVVVLVAAIGFGGITLRASAESHWQSGEENTPTPTGTLEPEASASSTPMSTATDSPDDPASPTPTLTSTNPPTETAEPSPTASPTAVELSPEPTATTPWYEGIVTPTPMPAEEVASQSSFGPQSFSTTSESTDLIVDDGPEDAYRPQVAFNPDAGVYLVVWQSSEDQVQTDIFARYLLGNGQPLTSTITLLEDVQGPVRTRLAYGGGSFLLVYREGSDRAAADLYSVALNGNPDPTPALSAPRYVHSPVGRKFAVAFRDAPGDEEFVVVFLDAAHPVLSGFGRGEIFGRRVSTSGEIDAESVTIIERSSVGSVQAVLNSPAFQVDLSFAYNPERDEFYLTWGIYDCTTVSCVDREDIWAQLIGGSSLEPGGRLWFITGNTPGIQWYQRIAYHAQLQKYLIVWADNRNSELEFDLFRQPVNQFGVPQGDDLVLIGESGSQVFPELSAIPFMEAVPPYVVVYQEEPVAGGEFAFAARVDESGTILESPFHLSDDGNSVQSMPAMAARPGIPSEWLSAWAHGRALGDNDVHARITVETGPRVDLVGPTDWTMVLSLRPTLRWNEFPDAARYRVTVRSFSEAGTAEELTSVELASSSSRDPENEGEHRWKIDVDLSSGTTLEDAGYEWTVQALDDAGNPLATSEIGTFQIPSLGGSWDAVQEGVCVPRTIEGVDPAPCNFYPAPNPHWNEFDDLIYRWSEIWDVPASLMKAMFIGETASALGPRRIVRFSGEVLRFSPARAYLYEPYQDWLQFNVFDCSLFPYAAFCQPGNPPSEEFEGFGPFNPPYDLPVPDGQKIVEYSLGRGFPWTNLGEYGLAKIPGCREIEAPSCRAGDLVAQYRLSASYGLGQVVYLFTYSDLTRFAEYVRPGNPQSIIPPEALYEPDFNILVSSFHLGQKRCNYPDVDLGGDSNLWDWEGALLDYNGGGNLDYGEVVIQRAVHLTQPTSVVTGPVDTVTEYRPHTCPQSNPLGSNSALSQGLATNVLQGEAEVASGTFEIGGDGESYWVNATVHEDPLTGDTVGTVKIYSADRSELLWASEEIGNVRPVAYLSTIGTPSGNLLMVQWAAGMHAVRAYPVALVDGEFTQLPIIDQAGNVLDGIGTDGGGVFPYADGSLATVHRTYANTAGERRITVFAKQDSAYEAFRSYIFDTNESEENPPETSVSLDTIANEEGWVGHDATLTMNAVDETAVDLIAYELSNAAEEIQSETPAESHGILLSEGRWDLSFRAFDVYGNVSVDRSFQTKIDSTPPQTSVSIDGVEGNSGWYVSSVEVELAAQDPVLAGGSDPSGISVVEYSLDDGQTWVEYSEPFLITGEGKNRILYRSSDLAGNVEDTKEALVKIDFTDPDAAVTVDPSELWPPNHKPVTIEVTIQADDATSGLQSLLVVAVDEYEELEFAPILLPVPSEESNTWTLEVEVVASRKGSDRDGREYLFTITPTDVAGNSSIVQAVVLVPHDQRSRGR